MNTAIFSGGSLNGTQRTIKDVAPTYVTMADPGPEYYPYFEYYRCTQFDSARRLFWYQHVELLAHDAA